MAAPHTVPVEKVQGRCLKSALPPIISVETGTAGIPCQSKHLSPSPSSALCKHHVYQQVLELVWVLGPAGATSRPDQSAELVPAMWGSGTSGRRELKIVSSPPQIFRHKGEGNNSHQPQIWSSRQKSCSTSPKHGITKNRNATTFPNQSWITWKLQSFHGYRGGSILNLASLSFSVSSLNCTFTAK